MEYIKKNWIKLLLATASFVCVILMLIPVFVMENFDFVGATPTIGFILFFVGLTVLICFKMFDKTKAIQKYVLLTTGILALIFLSIGATGLSKTEPKGALGKAYEYFASVESDTNKGETKLAESKAQVAALKELKGNMASLIAGFGAATSGAVTDTTQVKDIPSLATGGAATADLEQARQTMLNLGLSELTLAQTPVALAVIISSAEAQITAGEAEIAFGKTQIKDANAGALTVLFLYISLLVSMGIAPTLIGAKKVLYKEN